MDSSSLVAFLHFFYLLVLEIFNAIFANLVHFLNRTDLLVYSKLFDHHDIKINAERLYFKSEDEEVECAVCLCKIEKGEEICGKLRCGHVFHKCCLDRWLGYQGTTCPLCRGSVVPRRMVDRVGEKVVEELCFSFSLFRGSGDHGNWWLR